MVSMFLNKKGVIAMNDLSLLDNRNFLTVAEVADVIFDGHLSITTINTMIKQGKIPSEKLGRKNLIPVAFARKMLEANTKAEA